MAIPRRGKADEIAGMVAYLAGPDASLVTGTDLLIGGGFGARHFRYLTKGASTWIFNSKASWRW